MLDSSWVRTKFSISLVNQIDCKETITRASRHTFSSGESEWGWAEFVPLSAFHDEIGGYLVEDTCVLEAEISEIYVSPVSSDEVCAATSVKEIFDKLISFPLDDIADPKYETAMMDCLSMLTDRPDLFSDLQFKEIVKLKATFPQTVQEWRGSVQVKDTSAHPWSTHEKTKSLIRDLVKTEEGIRKRLKDLNNKEKELEAQLEAIKRNSRILEEEREEVSKETMILCSLAKEQSSRVQAKEAEVERANKTLEYRLKSKWVATRHLFS